MREYQIPAARVCDNLLLGEKMRKFASSSERCRNTKYQWWERRKLTSNCEWCDNIKYQLRENAKKFNSSGDKMRKLTSRGDRCENIESQRRAMPEHILIMARRLHFVTSLEWLSLEWLYLKLSSIPYSSNQWLLWTVIDCELNRRNFVEGILLTFFVIFCYILFFQLH